MVSLPIVGNPLPVRNAVASGPGVAAPALPSATSSTTPDSQGAALNPSLRLDLSLDLVIMEFHNSSGAVTQTIPSDRQLNAYRIAGVPGRDASGTAEAAGSASPTA